jgi:carbonic anhydrase
MVCDETACMLSISKVALVFAVTVVAISFLQSCNQSPKTEVAAGTIVIPEKEVIPGIVLNRERQERLTPDSVLQMLRQRNAEYAEDNLSIRNTSERIRNASLGQYPAAVVLSCLDSRVPVEDVFHSGIGDLFVARVAGNIANDDIVASLEYACKVSGAKAIVVLGHEYCGAIKSAIDNVQLGNITGLLTKIRQSMPKLSNFKGEKTSSNGQYVEAVTRQNILSTIDYIRQKSPILKEMEAKGQIKIVGAEYDMKTGRVEFL